MTDLDENISVAEMWKYCLEWLGRQTYHHDPKKMWPIARFTDVYIFKAENIYYFSLPGNSLIFADIAVFRFSNTLPVRLAYATIRTIELGEMREVEYPLRYK